MKEITYKRAVESIRTPYGLENRILRHVARHERKGPAWRPAAILAPALAVLAVFVIPLVLPGSEEITDTLPVTLSTVQPASEESAESLPHALPMAIPTIHVYAGEVDLSDPSVADGTHFESFGFETNENGEIVGFPSLFMQVGERDDPNIESVTMRSETGTLSSNLEFERKAGNTNWNELRISFSFCDWYKNRVSDSEAPTADEILEIFTELQQDAQLQEEMAVNIIIDGEQCTDRFNLGTLPKPSEINVYHKSSMDSGSVSVVFVNPKSTVRDRILRVKELTVIPYEEVIWGIEGYDELRWQPAENVDFTAYSDTISVETRLKDTRVVHGTIKLEVSEDGKLSAVYTEESQGE